MDKYASGLIKQGFDTGFKLYGIMKAANLGDPNARMFLNQAMKAAADAGMVDPAAMGGDPAATGAPAAPAPMPTIQCPQCSQQVTPSPEGMCPACGFDFNTLAAQAAQETVGNTAEEIKTAAVRNENVMRQLVAKYGRR